MPELPDIEIYIETLRTRIDGTHLQKATLVSPFLLRTAEPPLTAVEGKRVIGLRRIGKRIAIGFEGEIWLVFHLMIAGRLHWFDRGAPIGKRAVLARFEFDNGLLTLTEAGTKRRASLHIVQGERGLQSQDPGGAEPLQISLAEFAGRLRAKNQTVKRALTDPKIFSGIGNSFSDEMLHAARLSPSIQTRNLDDAKMQTLYDAVRSQLTLWTDRLREEAAGQFPEKVTAFRPKMAVHGRFGQPCPVCGTPVQRIRYTGNETNYCPRCQTGDKLLADRAMSRILKKDYPRTLDLGLPKR